MHHGVSFGRLTESKKWKENEGGMLAGAVSHSFFFDRRQQKYHELVVFLQSPEFLVDFSEIALGPKIGSGSFAKVWEGSDVHGVFILA